MARYRFAEFVLSPRRRVLLRQGRELPLIPRYFDLLLFLLQRRGEAVHRRDIFDQVWNDVVVSDSALSQAIRTIRRVLDDDPREPRFVRTVSRHGYEFVFADVREEEDGEAAGPAADAPLATATATPVSQAGASASGDPFAAPLAELLRTESDDDARGDAAERLHALGTAEAMRRIGTTAAPATAWAVLRDARWAVAEAGDVPLAQAPAPLAAASALIRLRLRRAADQVSRRWAAAALGGGAAGALGGAVGGLLLALVPGGSAPASVIPVLAVIGAGCGAFGAAGVGAGLATAEAVVRSRRPVGLTAGAAVGGGLAGLVAQALARWTLALLVGIEFPAGGALEGLLLGGATGLAYAVATPSADGGFAAPRGAARARLALVVAMAGGLAGLCLDLAGYPLVGGTVHALAQASAGAQAVLTPLGRLIGEPGFGPLSAALISVGEGALFGAGLAVGLTHRQAD